MRRRLFIQRGIATSIALGAGLARAALAGGQPVDRSSDGADEGSDRDRQVMRELAAFTRRSFATAHPIPFGAFVVRTATGDTVVRALNEVGPLLEPTAHGEIQAIRAACRRLKRVSLDGCTLYTTAEPCPMCMGAILWAGLDRVVFGATIADIARHLAQIHVAAREVALHSDNDCEVTGPVERALCNTLFDDPVLTPVYRLWRKRS
jgi:tRNA(Arg) A34 adenosine deaminase TadA